MRSPPLGIALGLIGSAIALPLSTQRVVSANDSSNQRIITEVDRDIIDSLRKVPQLGEDRRLQETKWAESVYPTIRIKLIDLYKAENEDAKATDLNKKDRQVKVFYSDFIKKGDEGNDLDHGPSLHVVKYFDTKQKDGSFLRTYVNEKWPVSLKTGGLLPPETIRVRAQVFKGSLQKFGSEDLFITDLLQIIWARNEDGTKGNIEIYPLLYRQNLFGKFDANSFSNPRNQLEVAISSPTSCISCHRSEASFTKIFLKPSEQKTNFAAIVPDEKFNEPYSEHRGFVKYMAYLEKEIEEGKLTKSQLEAIRRDLQNTNNLRVPYMVETLEECLTIPTYEGDIEDNDNDFKAEGFKYKRNNTTWTKAGFKNNFILGLGEWWFRDDLELVPKK